jgi:hypothetical protein
MSNDNTQDTNEPSPASAGSRDRAIAATLGVIMVAYLFSFGAWAFSLIALADKLATKSGGAGWVAGTDEVRAERHEH